MTAVININSFRKTRKKTEMNTRAACNRVWHGRRKDGRRRIEMAEERTTRNIDGRCLESDGLDDNEAAWDDYGLK